MKKTIGKVTLNDSFYKGSDLYSDGDEIEEEMLQLAMSGGWEQILQKSSRWEILYHFSDIRENIIEWYPIGKKDSVLEIGSGCGAISGCLCRKAGRVVGIELSRKRSEINAWRNQGCGNLELYIGNFKDIILEEKFDYVIMTGVLEYASLYMGSENPYEDMLRRVREFLKPGGKIIIAIENKMGLKYLNGAKEDHVGKRFAGIEDYRNITDVKTFSKPELTQMLHNCGITDVQFYYPVPDYKLPETIYSDAFLPREGDVRIWGTNYDYVRIAMYNDAIMADQVCRDGMFDYFSNSFLVVCNEKEPKIVYAHYTRQREKAYQTRTVVIEGENEKYVEKKYIHDVEKKYNILEMMNSMYPVLQNEFANVIYLPAHPDQEEKEEGIRYQFLTGETVERLIAQNVHDREKLLASLKEAFDYCFAYDADKETDFRVTDEYRAVFGETAVQAGAKALPVSNLDMSFGNLILQEQKIYCFDYEWVFDFPVPVDFMKLRCLNSFYTKYNMYFSSKLKKEEIMRCIGLKEADFPVLDEMETKFQRFTYGLNNRSQYLKNYKKPCGMMGFTGV